MENMRTILMHLDACGFLRINITADMAAPVNDQAASAPGGCFSCKYGAVDPGPDDQIIIHCIFLR